MFESRGRGFVVQHGEVALRDRAVQPIFTAIEVTVAPAREDPLVIENQPNDARPHFG